MSGTDNRWRSRFIAPPADGVLWRLVLPAGAEARLGESSVFVQTAGPRPEWLPRTRTAWSVRSIFHIPIGPLLPAPIPGIR
jgi:hypothetical protein